jgi:hypothetical protein
MPGLRKMSHYETFRPRRPGFQARSWDPARRRWPDGRRAAATRANAFGLACQAAVSRLCGALVPRCRGSSRLGRPARPAARRGFSWVDPWPPLRVGLRSNARPGLPFRNPTPSAKKFLRAPYPLHCLALAISSSFFRKSCSSASRIF